LQASPDVSLVSNKDYTKDPRHLVLLKGYHLQERAPSPSSEKEKANAAAAANVANTTIKQVGSPAAGQGKTWSNSPLKLCYRYSGKSILDNSKFVKFPVDWFA
jgi:hypothetical protein